MAETNDKKPAAPAAGTNTPAATPATPAAAPAATTPATLLDRCKAVQPDEGNINVFNEASYKVKGNFVHGYHKTAYVNLRNIDPELAATLADDQEFIFLEKVTG